MKKDKEWLKEQLSYLQDGVGESFNDYSKGLNAAYNTLEILINQLEEPEQEKPVIPQFVGEYIEERKGMSEHWFEALDSLAVDFHNNDTNKTGDRIFNWIMANPDLYVEGYRNGYSVEKEKLYKVLLPGVESLNRQMCMHEETREIGFADDGYNSRKYSEDDKFIRLFTEQEIKAIDERYWDFAEEVPND